ncbi:DNA polymerase III subunit beta [Candidatus Roizmanbacteria bacterium RIFCSPHIGHO2_01_FULL_39_12c]|uniref:Beta sliding clamp n=1 Tax=Candidatus Roizmanbacteria bacterium RIFCSPHIGHO2_01_FULL_39_12c TaxID=1802031 RepID=A0A1F7G936_9BACT|nr:MAG: DNA polymerase III subunit beta [Candidatus Roizmanbacteria bacterium RIFCSPHIGHO2_01_FULL_39_12c]OGK46494.1 MAG: DNA polymerase III subunit beta [Candidatus Roizmanbacteria bacterium RIFCSPLOWO2_01_FULL_40_13]
MIIKINRQEFIDKLTFGSRFTSTKLSSLQILQGVQIKKRGNGLHFFSSNLSAYYHSSLPVEGEKEGDFVVEPKKIIEFLSFLPDGKIDLEVDPKQLLIKAKKTVGRFPLIIEKEFPQPPKIEEKEQKINTGFLLKFLPLVLFAASPDETRPALSGVNFVTNDELIMVATDGFRLSLIKAKKETRFPPVIIPADFLKELIHFLKEDKETRFSYSNKEKTVVFRAGETELYSRLIEGDFPPYEKVIPQEKRTTVKLEKEEFLRNIKLISVFARDLSYIITLDIKKNGVKFMPKTTEGEENTSFQEAEVEGEGQKVAFNYKFILEFLNSVNSKNIIVDILRPDAPVAFRLENNKDFLHIIMPVRIQE